MTFLVRLVLRSFGLGSFFIIVLAAQAQAAPVCVADTHTDLQYVIDQCSHSGTRPASIVVQPGAAIAVAGNLTLRSNLNLRCETGAVIRKTGGSGGAADDLILIISVSNVFIEGCILDGGLKSTGQAHARDAVALQNSTNIHFSRIIVGGFAHGGIFGKGWHNVEIEGSTFGTAELGGWVAGNHGSITLQAQNGASDHVRVHHNICNGNISHSSCFKLEGLGATAASPGSPLQWIDVSHNQITVGTPCTSEPDLIGCLGIELFGANPSRLRPAPDDSANAYFTIADNLVQAEDGNPGNNAFCISLGGARFGTVTGNVVKDCKAVGMEIVASFATVSGNTLTNTGPITWDANTQPHTNVVITNNVSIAPACRGIFLIAGAGNFLDTAIISNNIVRGPFSACADTSAPAAVRVQAAGSNIFNVRLTGNTFQEVAAGHTAIETTGGSQIQVEESRFVNNHGTGLNLGFVSGGRNFTIKNNFYNGEGVFLKNNGTTIVHSSGNIVNGLVTN